MIPQQGSIKWFASSKRDFPESYLPPSMARLANFLTKNWLPSSKRGGKLANFLTYNWLPSSCHGQREWCTSNHGVVFFWNIDKWQHFCALKFELLSGFFSGPWKLFRLSKLFPHHTDNISSADLQDFLNFPSQPKFPQSEGHLPPSGAATLPRFMLPWTDRQDRQKDYQKIINVGLTEHYERGSY